MHIKFHMAIYSICIRMCVCFYIIYIHCVCVYVYVYVHCYIAMCTEQ